MTQRFFVGTIKPSKWLALTMSFNISKSRKRRDITLTDSDELISPLSKLSKSWFVRTHGHDEN